MCGLCVTEFSTGLSIYESQQSFAKLNYVLRLSRPGVLVNVITNLFETRLNNRLRRSCYGFSAHLTIASDGFALNRHGEFCNLRGCVRGYSFRPHSLLQLKTSFDQSKALLDEYRCHLQLCRNL